MATKLTLTPEAQAKVIELLAAEPTLTAGLGPVPPLGRNASLVRLVDGHQDRTTSITALLAARISRTRLALSLKLAAVRRYGLLGAIVKVFYWRVSWDELAYRTERKYYLRRPAYWTEEAS